MDEENSLPEEQIQDAGPEKALDGDDFRDDIAKREHRQSRLTTHSIPDLPEVVAAETYLGIEVVQDDYKEAVIDAEKGIFSTDKETLFVEQLPETYDEEGGKETATKSVEPAPYERPSPVRERLDRRLCGIRVKWLLFGIMLFLILVIGLGAGLGAGLSTSSTASKAEGVQPSGALEGTSISVVTQSFAEGEPGGGQESLVMYFQHRSGQIRWMRLDNNGSWVGGDSSTSVALDAKRKTPISAVSYLWNGANFWRVYYIDITNTLKEVWMGNQTQGWTLGPLSDMDISPMNDVQTGMRACWYGPTVDGKHNIGSASTTDAHDLAIRVIYAADETTFHEMSYRGDTQVFTVEEPLPNLNAHATPACYSQRPGTIDYLMLVDLQDRVIVYWRDTNTNNKNSTSHPINRWTNSSITIPNIDPSADLAYTNSLYAQSINDNMIKGYNIKFNAENTTLAPSDDFIAQKRPGIPGTGLAATVHSNDAGQDDVLVFYQTNGTKISEYRRSLNRGAWTQVNIRIPFD